MIVGMQLFPALIALISQSLGAEMEPDHTDLPEPE